MIDYSKGEITRRNIISKVNALFNDKEMLLNWDEMAAELGVNRSRITNYFPKKELLITAIFYDFQQQLKALIQTLHSDQTDINFNLLQEYYSSIFDLLYQFRFALSYVLVNPMNDENLRVHLDNTNKNNKRLLYNRVENLVKAGKVKESLLEDENFLIFNFQHANLISTWVINYRLYDQKSGFDKMKPIYIKGVLSCFLPYLTPLGIKEFDLLEL